MIRVKEGFKIITQDQTDEARKLRLVPELEKILNQVEQFKAIVKLERLLYKPLPPDASKYANKHHSDLALTDFGYYISERWGGIRFCFYRLDEGSNRVELDFSIEEKTIPAIIAGFERYKAMLKNNFEEVHKPKSIYMHSLDDKIEEYFSQPMTAKCFNETKAALVDYLLSKVDEIRKLKAGRES